MRKNFNKRSLILVLVVLMAITFVPLKSEVHAVYAYYQCTVVSTGSTSANYVVCLTDVNGSFANKYMTIYSNAALATALTALSLGKTVLVACDPALATPVVSAIYVVN